jgi:hypothetical protein
MENLARELQKVAIFHRVVHLSVLTMKPGQQEIAGMPRSRYRDFSFLIESRCPRQEDSKRLAQCVDEAQDEVWNIPREKATRS